MAIDLFTLLIHVNFPSQFWYSKKAIWLKSILKSGMQRDFLIWRNSEANI